VTDRESNAAAGDAGLKGQERRKGRAMEGVPAAADGDLEDELIPPLEIALRQAPKEGEARL
jgi:hypothetical protein